MGYKNTRQPPTRTLFFDKTRVLSTWVLKTRILCTWSPQNLTNTNAFACFSDPFQYDVPHMVAHPKRYYHVPHMLQPEYGAATSAAYVLCHSWSHQAHLWHEPNSSRQYGKSPVPEESSRALQGEEQHQTGAGTGAAKQNMADLHDSHETIIFSQNTIWSEAYSWFRTERRFGETIPESFNTATGCSYGNIFDQCLQCQHQQNKKCNTVNHTHTHTHVWHMQTQTGAKPARAHVAHMKITCWQTTSQNESALTLFTM